MTPSNLAHAVLIFGSVFVLEDVAVIGAALLVVNEMVSLPWAAGASFAGIWAGDIGLYLLASYYGRSLLEKSWFKRLFGKRLDLGRTESWFQKHGMAALLLSRAVPPARLPAYVVSGLLGVRAARFVTVTAATCLVWVAALFWLSYHVGVMAISAFQMFRSEAAKLAACVVVAAGIGWLLRKALKRIRHGTVSAKLKRIFRWEFWPPAIFYIPVAVKYLSLAIKYRSLSLPTLANPGMHTGGLIGESKFETLSDLARVCPESVVETYLIRFASVEQQTTLVLRLRDAHRLAYPLVFKPDVGQRGFGFKIVRSDDEARSYVEQFSCDLLIQKYAPGPHEVGIFYYRLPSEDKGRIFAITEKVFPVVVGDGRHTLEELIRRDPRASIVAGKYLNRFANDRGRVLAAGEALRLVEAGNHCQGAIFLDGTSRLFSNELERTIDEISKSVRGFFVGRYDVRYTSEEALKEGREFQIIELNGASSEATNIYDPNNSLRQAYATLFRQWEIIFAVANENRKQGLQTTPLKTIWENWAHYRIRSSHAPVSD